MTPGVRVHQRTQSMSTARLAQPVISETWILEQRLVGQGLQERDQVGALFLRQRKTTNRAAFVPVVRSDTRFVAVAIGPSAGSVVVDRIFEPRRHCHGPCKGR